MPLALESFALHSKISLHRFFAIWKKVLSKDMRFSELPDAATNQT